MTIIQAIILGIVQGLTEFLPISSSAHLVIVPALFGWEIPEQQAFTFDVLVQLGTLLAVIVYFWSDLLSILKAVFQGLKKNNHWPPRRRASAGISSWQPFRLVFSVSSSRTW